MAPDPAALALALGLARAVAADLRVAGHPQRAERERAYLKSDREFLGAAVPAIRRVAAALHARYPDLGHAEVAAVVDALWAEPIHECRMAAVELLRLYSGVLGADDVVLVERLLRQSRTWALVDSLAAHVAGPLVAGHPELGATLDRWAGDDDFWVRRAALLALLVPLRDGGGDAERFFRYADGMLNETEFFIRKAIGWVLRDISKRRPVIVRDWLAPRAHRASGVTMREAVKYLDPDDRAALMAAYRATQRWGP